MTTSAVVQPGRRTLIGWAVALGLLSLITVTSGLEQAFHFAGSPMDGPLQLYNSLRRIAAGQRPGVDFQVFHGVGLAYLHYIPFRLSGGTFAAAEFWRQLLSAVLYPLSLLIVFRIFTRSWHRTIALSVAVMAASLALHLATVVVAINSLLGARSFVATLVPAIWYATRSKRYGQAVTGAVAGLALLCGTEQGLAVIMAASAIHIVLIARSRSARAAGDLGLFLAGVIAAVGLLLLALAGPGGAASILRYNLAIIPRDQYWYFGAPPSNYAATWPEFMKYMVTTPLIPAVILFAGGYVVLHLRRLWSAATDDDRVRSAALALLALYGLLSCASILGIFLVGYAGPGARAVLILTGLELARSLEWNGAPAKWFRQPRWVAVVAVALMVLAVPGPTIGPILGLPHFALSHLIERRGMEFQGIWPRGLEMTDSILRATPVAPGQMKLWSTYSGLAEARMGTFNPSFDYIIHALGPEYRRAYAERFKTAKPALVQTLLPTYSPYEAWLSQTSGDFYSELLQNYRAVAATPWSIFWTRLPMPAPAPRLMATIVPSGDSATIAIPASTGGPPVALLDIAVRYGTTNALARLPLVGTMPRYLIGLRGGVTGGPVTLDPYTTTAHFPIIAINGRPLTMRFYTESLLPGATVTVSEVRVSEIPITRDNGPWIQNSISAEERWNAGRR